ncbi:hypothetical protein [uncultured Draconibacterium sp.]|uniref:hypothetical protein n=1 Tax=uncultured Draconibacterium sp. TaxID=1573823 RepID=UPI002AA81DD7|nr:hypothetical protein [uncultured Draconibacterium sp.]
MINKKDYSLLLLQTVERLFNRIRKFVAENSDILEFTKDEDFMLLIEDKSKSSNFKFLVSNPHQNPQNKILFNAEYNPQNSSSIASRKTTVEDKSVISYLEQWTNLIRQYNKISLTTEQSIINEYEKEFYDNFEIVDEDADTHPYELSKQVMISNYFAHVIKVLEAHEDENAELIKEAEEIRESIPKMTKKTTIKRISRFFAKVRNKSLPLLKEILELGKKELFKRAITAGFDMIGDLTNLI